MANESGRGIPGSTAGTSEPAVDREALLRALEAAHGRCQANDHEQGKQEFLQVRATAARAGIRSAAVEWGLAIAFDGLGDFDRALFHIGEAIALDQLDLQYARSYRVICEHLRNALKLAEEQDERMGIEHLYGLLTRTGEADIESHLAASRFLVRSGRAMEALRILDAVTVLHPTCSTAWRLLAQAALTLGDSDLADRARLEAKCCPAAGSDSDRLGPRGQA